MRFCKLRQKAVVNVLDGRSLGLISDLVIDECTGRIVSIVVPGGCGWKGIFKARCYVIPWSNICKIGDDIILVEADLNVCCSTN